MYEGRREVVYPDKMCQCPSRVGKCIHDGVMYPGGTRMVPTPGRRWLQRYEMDYIQKGRGLVK